MSWRVPTTAIDRAIRPCAVCADDVLVWRVDLDAYAERADRAWAIDIDEATPLVGQARSTAGSVSAGACTHGPDGDADRDDP